MGKNLPIVLGGALIGAVVLVLALWSPPQTEEDIVKSALDRIHDIQKKLGLAEGTDYRIDPPKIIQRTDTQLIVRIEVRSRQPDTFYYLLKPGKKEWEFDRDIYEDFVEFVKAENKRIGERLTKTLSQRYSGAAIELRVKDNRMVTLEEQGGKIAGIVSWEFVQKFGHGKYMESFTYENKAWVLNGEGRLLDLPPGR